LLNVNFIQAINDFITETFNSDGKHKDGDFDTNPSKWNCGFCPFKGNKELCLAGAFS